jgi:hypothetical protein
MWNISTVWVGSMMINDGRRTRKMISRIAMEKATFKKQKTLFTRKLGLNLRREIVKCYIWSTAFYDAET